MTSPHRLPHRLATELERQYDIVRLLGEGGMGAVWLARERSLDRHVAIKILAGENVTTEHVRERFRREARIAARLLHPNIVPLFAFGETSDALYFAMGYVEGESLADRLEREGRLPRAAALRILAEISDALAFAHREGVVHRDVKPENILLDGKSGRAMLADFGIARVEDAATSVTRTGIAVGTPSYMSPEQALGLRDVDGRSDIYSLGVVGYRMLMGRLPFSGPGARALMAQHATAKPDDLALAVSHADRELARVIMCAIEKEPAARWAKAEDLRDELQTLARTGSRLPEGLERVEMVGTKFLGANVVILGIWYLASLWDTENLLNDPNHWWFLALNLCTLPALGVAWAVPTARKFGWRDTLRAMLHPPKSWAHWWPKALRRAEDLWDRLPKPVRRLRKIIDGVVTYFVVDMAAFLVIATTGGGAYGDFLLSIMRDDIGLLTLAVTTKIIPLAWIGVEFVRARRKLGLSSAELRQLLGIPHVADDPAWSRPKFARLLSPEERHAESRAPQSPDDLARAIRSLATRLVRAGVLPGDETIDAAESVRDAIAALEAEVQRLHREMDPAEGDRLERRLASLGTDEDDAELKPLLEGQLALLRRLEGRRRDKEARRDRLREQLHTLWMHLLELDGRITQGAPVDPDLTSRVRALSSDLGHLGEAMTEVERMLQVPPTLEVTPR